MNYREQIYAIAKNQKGTLLSLDLDSKKIPRTYLSMMVADGEFERINRGVYVKSEQLEDEMFILQKRFPNIIFSHETALFLHGLSDRTPFEFSVTVPSGYKVVKSLSEKAKTYYIKKELHDLGIASSQTPLGNTVFAYNAERTICDTLRSRNRMDIQIFSDALKRLNAKKQLDLVLLLEYAKKLRVDKILTTYMEVLI